MIDTEKLRQVCCPDDSDAELVFEAADEIEQQQKHLESLQNRFAQCTAENDALIEVLHENGIQVDLSGLSLSTCNRPTPFEVSDKILRRCVAKGRVKLTRQEMEELDTVHGLHVFANNEHAECLNAIRPESKGGSDE